MIYIYMVDKIIHFFVFGMNNPTIYHLNLRRNSFLIAMTNLLQRLPLYYNAINQITFLNQ